MNSMIEAVMQIPAEHETNIFGQFDENIKKIERTLNVTMISRDGQLKMIGPSTNVKKARSILEQLVTLAERGNTITGQQVDYAVSLSMEEKESAIVEMDKDCICHTINGRAVKPKTLGQKQYVDSIRKKYDCIWNRTGRYGKDLSGDGYGDHGVPQR